MRCVAKFAKQPQRQLLHFGAQFVMELGGSERSRKYDKEERYTAFPCAEFAEAPYNAHAVLSDDHARKILARAWRAEWLSFFNFGALDT